MLVLDHVVSCCMCTVLYLVVTASWLVTFVLSYTPWTVVFGAASIVSLILSIYTVIAIEDELVGRSASKNGQ